MVENICGLEVTVRKTEGHRVAILIQHGYGADMKDLASIEKFLGRDLAADWFFPNAPLQVPIGPMMMGRAWFPIDAGALERAMQKGEFREFKSNRPQGMDESKEQLQGLYDKLQNDYDHVIIGGFSQGAMMSCDLAFSSKNKPAALIIMSGAYVDESHWSDWAKTCSGLKFFQSHGFQDPVLPAKGAEDLNEMLQKNGLQGDFHEFQGGHEIPPNIIVHLQQFLHKVVNSLTK